MQPFKMRAANGGVASHAFSQRSQFGRREGEKRSEQQKEEQRRGSGRWWWRRGGKLVVDRILGGEMGWARGTDGLLLALLQRPAVVHQ